MDHIERAELTYKHYAGLFVAVVSVIFENLACMENALVPLDNTHCFKSNTLCRKMALHYRHSC